MQQVTLKGANELYRCGKFSQALTAYQRLRELFPDLSVVFDANIKRTKLQLNLSPDTVGERHKLNDSSNRTEELEINFADEQILKISQNCERNIGWLVSGQDGSTPGFKLVLPDNLTVAKVKLCQLEACANKMSIFMLDQRGIIVNTVKFTAPQTAQDVLFEIENPKAAVMFFVTLDKPQVGDRFRFQTLTLTPLKQPKNAPFIRRQRSLIAAGVASIPSRIDGLVQAVSTIAQQVDEVHVFLNGYSTVPTSLANIPEVKVYLSEEYDDLGDSGKFFGLAHGKSEFCLTFDDDIIYPTDYVETLVALAKQYKSPTGVHGSILRFPLLGYYNPLARSVFHFSSGNKVDRRVHILGTGTLCFSRDILPKMLCFKYRNMADIWFAKHCADHNVAQICIARPEGWLNPLGTDNDSIYQKNHSVISDQKSIVDKQLSVESMRLASLKGIFPKIVVGIKTFNRLPYLKDCLSSLLATISDNFEVVIVVADDGSTDGTNEYLANLKSSYEIHVIYNNRAYVSGQANSIIERAMAIQADFIFLVDDDIHFKQQGWMKAYFDAAMRSGYHHLCHFNLPHYQQLCAKRGEPFPRQPSEHSQHPLVAYSSVDKCMGALFTLTPSVINTVGWADEVNFFVRGMWHVDYSARCCRAGFNESQRFFDIKDANNYLELQNTKSEQYETSISWESEDFKRASTNEERNRRRSLIAMSDRIFVSHELATQGELIEVLAINKKPLVRVNDVFDCVFVINLDRRYDRLNAIDARLNSLGIEYKRFAAIDGTQPEIIREYEIYTQARTFAGAGKSLSSREFNLGDLPDVQRVGHLEGMLKGPAIRTAGAWAYAKTYQQILRCALSERYERILVLDDDGYFHKNFNELFDQAIIQLPTDWKIFQLGSMQYDWELVRPYSKNLYLPDGVVVASHAVGFHLDVVPIMMDYLDRWSLPFDIGPLHYACRAFREKSFIISPNLIIQDQTESDISSSEVAKSEAGKKNNIYRWEVNDYF